MSIWDIAKLYQSTEYKVMNNFLIIKKWIEWNASAKLSDSKLSNYFIYSFLTNSSALDSQHHVSWVNYEKVKMTQHFWFLKHEIQLEFYLVFITILDTHKSMYLALFQWFKHKLTDWAWSSTFPWSVAITMFAARNIITVLASSFSCIAPL